MSILMKLVKAFQRLYQHSLHKLRSIPKKLMNWLLRRVWGMGRRWRFANSGFVLPTVTMVMLVVVLLTTAIVFRSFDRAKNASNNRASTASIAAATPAIDRAKAKIDRLFDDPRLPRSTPTEVALYNVIRTNPQFTFGDEQRLKIAFDIDDDGIDSNDLTNNVPLVEEETSTTAWRFPVDTDNNGKFDSYTLYSILFRSPPRDASGAFDRKRTPLEARTPPMEAPIAKPACQGALGTSASLVGSSDWYKSGANLKKSFYVYTLTVPITDLNNPPTGYENYKGNQGFSALEYQQDREQVPLSNNAVVYEDDLQITPGSGLKLNGRVMTNSNLIVGRQSRNPDLEFYQVSSPESCFYQEENGKIVVGGNAVVGNPSNTNRLVGPEVDLFESGNPPTQTTVGDSNTNNTAAQVAYNSQEYANRINTLVSDWISDNTAETSDPQEVQDRPASQDRRTALENYFRSRTRRVPTAEAASAGTYTGTGDELRPLDTWIYPVDPTNNNNSNNGIGLKLAQYPATEPDQQERQGRESKIGDRLILGNGLPAKWWDGTGFAGSEAEQEIQPATTWTGSQTENRYRQTQITELSDLGNTDPDGFWEEKAAIKPANPLDGVGGMRVVTGAGIYSHTGSSLPAPSAPTSDDNSTVVDETALTPVWPDSMPMWIDTNLNDTPEATDGRGDLVMRGTVVYHYKTDPIDDPETGGTDKEQAPIACISSYYDPSTERTATNRLGLKDIRYRDTNIGNADRPRPNPSEISSGDRRIISSAPPNVNSSHVGLSHNGVSYNLTTSSASIAQQTASNGIFSPATGADDPTDNTIALADRLAYQANLVFPNGRLVNEPLRQALAKAHADRTLSEQSAIDAEICALKIADGTIGSPNGSVVPHGAIYETAFLDSREIKAIDQNNPPDGDYDLEISQRQPLEIRATVLDLDLLRRKGVGGSTPGPSPEYLLPDSGIIYATRNDALRDLSALWTGTPVTSAADEQEALGQRQIQSPVDFQLDPTRRPSAIMLINGSVLARGGAPNAAPSNTYDLVSPEGAEKGLILATNLPAYIRADDNDSNSSLAVEGFNLHQSPSGATVIEEFDDLILADQNPTWSRDDFYGRTSLDSNFACRAGDTRINCTGGGDLWRSATVLADSVTLLSNNFRLGYRNEGDYDLRNNIGDSVSTARLNSGFVNNNFVTSRDFQDADYSATGTNLHPGLTPDPNLSSSYFNNFVTPIQRRIQTHEYLMEVCTKLVVSDCGPDDWSIDGAGAKSSDHIGDNFDTDYGTAANIGDLFAAGSTAQPTIPALQRYPRRVAFERNSLSNVLLPTSGNPVPLGIDSSGNVAKFPYDGTNTFPRTAPNALWFKGSNNSSTPTAAPAFNPTDKALYIQSPATGTAQPLLAPVLQLQTPTGTVASPTARVQGDVAQETYWQQRAVDTTANLVFAGGDPPIGASRGEENGGLVNFVRAIENWTDPAAPGNPTNPKIARISGSFIQFKHSAYATAPFEHLRNLGAAGIFGYVQEYRAQSPTRPYYLEPQREWGFDVGLLSQLPDLFAQRFTADAAGDPDEFYREVGRNDPWVQALMCAKVASDNVGDIGATYRVNANAIPDSQRPSNCLTGNYPPNT